MCCKYILEVENPSPNKFLELQKSETGAMQTYGGWTESTRSVTHGNKLGTQTLFTTPPRLNSLITRDAARFNTESNPKACCLNANQLKRLSKRTMRYKPWAYIEGEPGAGSLELNKLAWPRGW